MILGHFLVLLLVTALHKGYKCLDEKGNIYVSRHVVFNEFIFPFNEKSSNNLVNSSSSQSHLPFPLLNTPKPIIIDYQSIIHTNSNHSNYRSEGIAATGHSFAEQLPPFQNPTNESSNSLHQPHNLSTPTTTLIHILILIQYLHLIQ